MTAVQKKTKFCFALRTRKIYFLFFDISGLQRKTKLNSVNRENHQQSLKQHQSLKQLYFCGIFQKLLI